MATLQSITYPAGSTEAWCKGHRDGWLGDTPARPDCPHYMEGWEAGYRDRRDPDLYA